MNLKLAITRMIILLLLLLPAACGKKGRLVPPDSLIPVPVSDLQVMQKGDTFVLYWSKPEKEEGGRPLKDLAGFKIFRREVLPYGQDCETCPNAYQLTRTVDLESPEGISRSGDLFIFTDYDLVEGRTYQYKLVSWKKNGAQSLDSIRVRRKKVKMLPPPVINSSATPTSVTIRWKLPALPANGRFIGCNLYRKTEGGDPSISLLTPSPVESDHFEDFGVERGLHYAYSARAVAEVDGETIESELSDSVVSGTSQSE